LWLVVAVGVDGELAKDFAGGGVDDADVEVLGEDQDAGSGVGSADADVVQAAVDAQGDGAAGVDDVFADAFVGCGLGAGLGCGLGQGGLLQVRLTRGEW
jgi:hypothetical protein